ncbi:MAG TPA: CaiB/BaiF CoA-transferase family protein [Trebonia sp.]
MLIPDDRRVTGTETGSAAPLPLRDVRVLDLSLLLPGPFCTQMLADLGADVIKVEPPGGDYARRMPSELFAVANRNKRSVVLDLKRPADHAALLRIAAAADVAVEGFRPGVTGRLGVGYEDLRRVRPDIVYCSLSGYGQSGPMSQEPGHDGNYLAAGGALSFSGHWLEPPRRSGVPVADLAGASFAAVSVMAALHRRALTGQGTYLDVSLADSVLSFATVRAGARLDLANDGRRHLYPTNDLFTTGDGEVLAIGVVEDHFWDKLRKALGPDCPELLDARFDTESGRHQNGDSLKRLLDDTFARRPAGEWMAELRRHDVPAQRVLTVAEAAGQPQVRSRGIVAERDGQRHVVFPVLDGGLPMGRLSSLAPELGAHTSEVLREFGVPGADIDAITGRADGVLPRRI